MPTRIAIALFAFGLFLQGCSLQKRSLMPGWHVERAAKAPTSPGGPVAVGANCTASTEPSVEQAAVTVSLQDPLIPLKALMAFSPAVESEPELRIPIVLQEAHTVESLLIANDGLDEQQAKRQAKAPGGLIAALLYVLAYWFISVGLITILVGFSTGAGEVVLGLLMLLLAGRLIRSARNPESDWRRRAVERYEERRLERVEQSEERAENEAELEANRAAREEELRLKEEQRIKEQEARRLQEEAAKQARKAKRQAFFQDPFVKIALGFGAIIGLYLLLF
jgi:hypothetical protein